MLKALQKVSRVLLKIKETQLKTAHHEVTIKKI